MMAVVQVALGTALTITQKVLTAVAVATAVALDAVEVVVAVVVAAVVAEEIKRTTMERKTTHNSTLAIGGVSSPFDSFVVAESLVLRTNHDSYRDAEKPAHRQSAKRYSQW